MARSATKLKESDQPPAEDPRIARTRLRAGALKAALGDVNAAIEARNTIPILSHVLVQAIDGRLVLTATNLDMWVVRDLATRDGTEPDAAEWQAGSRNFGVCVPGGPLRDVVGELDKDAMVTLLVEPDREGITLSAGRARFRMMALPVGDFPLPPPPEVRHAMSLTCPALLEAIGQVEHAISTEETRYYLNGIYVHAHETDLRLATTDGHRLCRLTLPGPEGAATFPAAIVPRAALAVLKPLLAEAVKAAASRKDGGDSTPPAVTVESEAGLRLRFELPAADGGAVSLITKAIDGSFPDYGRVIPDGNTLVATLDRVRLAEAIKRVAVLADSSRAVKASFAAGVLTLTTRSAELGEAREELPCSWSHEPFEIGFDSRYWRQALAALACERVAMAFAEGGLAEGGGDLGGPCLIQDSEHWNAPGPFAQVLMPTRV